MIHLSSPLNLKAPLGRDGEGSLCEFAVLQLNDARRDWRHLTEVLGMLQDVQTLQISQHSDMGT